MTHHLDLNLGPPSAVALVGGCHGGTPFNLGPVRTFISPMAHMLAVRNTNRLPTSMRSGRLFAMGFGTRVSQALMDTHAMYLARKETDKRKKKRRRMEVNGQEEKRGGGGGGKLKEGKRRTRRSRRRKQYNGDGCKHQQAPRGRPSAISKIVHELHPHPKMKVHLKSIQHTIFPPIPSLPLGKEESS